MDLEAFRSELDDLAGLDLEPTERDRLINEGYVKLSCEADWLRANLGIGPTVADQAFYELPANVYRVLHLKVADKPYFRTDEESVDNLVAGNSYSRVPSGSGWYWLSYDATGDERLSLYPTPGTAGLTVTARVVLRPELLVDPADEPLIPFETHRYVIEYAKSIAYGSLEDNQDLQAFHRGEFDRGVDELRRLRNSKAGRSPVHARVIGIHV